MQCLPSNRCSVSVVRGCLREIEPWAGRSEEGSSFWDILILFGLFFLVLSCCPVDLCHCTGELSGSDPGSACTPQIPLGFGWSLGRAHSSVLLPPGLKSPKTSLLGLCVGQHPSVSPKVCASHKLRKFFLLHKIRGAKGVSDPRSNPFFLLCFSSCTACRPEGVMCRVWGGWRCRAALQTGAVQPHIPTCPPALPACSSPRGGGSYCCHSQCSLFLNQAHLQ